MASDEVDDQHNSEDCSHSELKDGSAVNMKGGIIMSETTIHDNEMYLSISGVKELYFKVKECIASDGQPIEKDVACEIGDDGISWKLTFRAGRHNSDTVAKKFITYITGDKATSGASIGCKTGETHPKELNFAFLGDLYFVEYKSSDSGDENDDNKYALVGKDIVIAQGHNKGGDNNWWIGGRNMENVYDAKILKGIRQSFPEEEISNNTDEENEQQALFGSLLLFSPGLNDANRFTITKVTV